MTKANIDKVVALAEAKLAKAPITDENQLKAIASEAAELERLNKGNEYTAKWNRNQARYNAALNAGVRFNSPESKTVAEVLRDFMYPEETYSKTRRSDYLKQM